MTIPSTRSELAIPLIVRDEVVGVLDCQSDQENFFDSTIDLLTLFSTQASIALQNARLYSLEQRKARQLEAINAIARQTTAVLEVNELLRKSCEVILQSFPVDHVAILLNQDDTLVQSAHQGKLTPRFPEGGELSPGTGLCARAMQTGRPVVENDVLSVPGYVPGFVETRSELCLPLVSLGETLGVLTLESARPNAFQPADLQPLESVADICAVAMQNARYIERVRQLAYVDGLTGMFNRRFFEMRIADEIERSKRYGGGFAVIMIDIDNFKRLNDDFGHLLGDEVLRQMLSIFSHNLRKTDVACRYGGEEFVVITPHAAGESGMAIAEKLRRVSETWHFPGVPRAVTISAGVASMPEQGLTRDELVRAADDALYAAKQGGRNRVIAAGSQQAVTNRR
jgi:diguanylate cyclase (GGDEF)-like protein